VSKIRLVCVSDTHNQLHKIAIPEGDILVHAGDLAMRGSLKEIAAFNDFLGTLPHPHKVVVAGNHDLAFEREPERARALLTHAIYLQDEAATVAGLRFWGAPWQPWFFDWAFNLPRGPALAEKWARIPEGTDVLITHGPPQGQGDRTDRGDLAGCADLLAAVRRVRPRCHVFGHIHEGYGVTREGDTRFVNASICTVDYRPTNPPIVIDLDR
jgi:Icc-related predicted phosphoesterase